MSKKKSPDDRSAKIEGDATGNVIITGDGNVVSLGGTKSKSGQDQPTAEPRSQRRRPTFPPAYRQWLRRHCADIDLLGVRLKQGQAVKLNHVYVPLMTTAAEEEPRAKGRRRDRSEQEELLLDEMRWGERRQKPKLLLAQLDKTSLYVPGDPGSGKSTFCRWVAWLVAAGEMPPAEVSAEEGYIETFPQALADRLPLLVRLRDVWRFLPRDPGRDWLPRAELESALGNWVDTGNPGGLDWADVTPHLTRGTALLFFDGVDEVPLREGEGSKACYPRAALIAGLIDAASAWQRQGNRMLVTSRPYGIDQREVQKLPLRHAPIRELDDTLQALLVHRWFRILQDDADEAERNARMAQYALLPVQQRTGQLAATGHAPAQSPDRPAHPQFARAGRRCGRLPGNDARPRQSASGRRGAAVQRLLPDRDRERSRVAGSQYLGIGPGSPGRSARDRRSERPIGLR